MKAELVVNVGGIVTNLRAGNPRNRGSIPSRTPKHAAAFFPEVQRPRHEIDYVPAFSVYICFWRDSRQWARASPFTKFLDHTQRRTTIGRTPLDE
jgi:hypothetical protein